MQYKTFKMNPWLKRTNKIWNDLRLNSGWSIGIVSKLIQEKKFNSIEEWSNHYFESGEKRLELIKSMDKKYQVILLDPLSSDSDMRKVPNKLKKVNYEYGRTKKELDLRAAIMYGNLCMQEGFQDLTMIECVNLVIYRVITETYNGVIIREFNTAKNLKKQLCGTLKHSSPSMDSIYGVDYCLYSKNKLAAGIQVKPLSYKHSNKDYIRDAMALNKQKENKLYKDYGIPLYYVFSNYNGEIYNAEVVEDINNYLNSFNNENKIAI